MAFFSLSGAIYCIGFPLLISKGLILIDYNNATKYSKAKNNFSIITLGLPAIYFWILGFSKVGDRNPLYFIIIAIIVFAYIHSIYILLKGERNIT